MDIEDFVNRKLTKTGEMPNGDNIYLITEKSVNAIKEQLRIGGVVSSLPNKALMDSQLSDMISGYKIMCKPDANFEKYYSKGFTECWEWLKRLNK